MSPLAHANPESSEPPDPAAALANDLPAYTDFARAYLKGIGVSDGQEVIALADDAIQNAWIALRNNLAFDSGRPVRPWVKQHIRTAARDVVRAKRTADGEHRLVRTSGMGDDAPLPEDEVYALLAGDAGQTPPDDEAYDRQKLRAWVDANVNEREREMLRLSSLGYTGRALTDQLNAAFSTATRSGTVSVQLHRLLERLATGYIATLRPADQL